MRLTFSLAVLIVFAWGAWELLAAPFENLDFEEAMPPLQVLPDWQTDASGPIYNNVCLGAACVSVHDASSLFLNPSVPLQGSYSAFLQGGTSDEIGSPPLVGASISQVGDVPVDAKSIRLLSTPTVPIVPQIISYENLRVSLDGIDIPLFDLGIMGNTIQLGGDVFTFAGNTAELKIETKTPQSGGPELWAWVDQVSFSSAPIPEPAAHALTVIGLFGIFVSARRPSRADPRRV